MILLTNSLSWVCSSTKFAVSKRHRCYSNLLLL